MESPEKIMEIRKNIIEHAIHMHENVISTLRQEIYHLDDLRYDESR